MMARSPIPTWNPTKHRVTSPAVDHRKFDFHSTCSLFSPWPKYFFQILFSFYIVQKTSFLLQTYHLTLITGNFSFTGTLPYYHDGSNTSWKTAEIFVSSLCFISEMSYLVDLCPTIPLLISSFMWARRSSSSVLRFGGISVAFHTS